MRPFYEKEGIVIKRLIALILTVLLAVPFFSACKTEKNKKSDKLSIVSTIFPYYDFAREITGDRADIELLLTPGSEVHDFEPSPQDIIKINNADIFIYNGGESEEWVEDILEEISPKVKILKMFDYIEPLYEEDINHNKGDEYDEHIFTTPKNALKLSKAIFDAACKASKKDYSVFNENFSAFREKLNKLDNDFASMKKTRPMVVADRFPLLYLAKQYKLEYKSAFPGCTSETQPSIKTVTGLIDYAKESHTQVVFHIDNSSPSLANLIAEDCGARVDTYYSCHNITKEQFEKGTTYISLLELNYTALKEAIT